MSILMFRKTKHKAEDFARKKEEKKCKLSIYGNSGWYNYTIRHINTIGNIKR